MTDQHTRQDSTAARRWRRIQEVLAAAIDLEGDARRQLVADRCAEDEALATEIELLLEAHGRTGLVDRLADAIAPVTSLARTQALDWQGLRVGQYVVEDLLGAGGMGLVYKAQDERLARRVALKFLSPHLSNDAAAKLRFFVEARAAAALDHPNVCTIHEIGETADGQLFIAMPVYDGETLRARLKRGPLPFDEAIPIALQVARALASAHERGIVHCDIKPSNVMLLADGTAKVLDFGIARVDNNAAGGQPVPIGTVAYMSPEQLRGIAVDHRADIWSLGILVHEMVTGVRPFDGDDRQTVSEAILTGSPKLVSTSHPGVPAGMDVLLGKALARRPEERYPAMSAMAAELEALQSAQHGPASLASAQKPCPIGERRRAAVLVTRISGYDALVEQLAPRDVHRLLLMVWNIAAEVVRRHGGIVNQAIGEEIVSLFGVPTAHEDDELRSVRAAMELHARVPAESAGFGAGIRVQSGLDAGVVVVQPVSDGPRRYGLAGATAQIASRLAAAAQPGDIVLSAECQRPVAPFVHVDPCAGVTQEHEGRTVRAFRVTGETGLETRLEASERSGLTPYVGRQLELALLEACVQRARAGNGSEIVVAGDAGAGKSRLLYELRERVAALDSMRLLHGRCRGYEVAPYGPFIDVLRDALELRTPAIVDSREIVERVRAIDASLDPFLPLYLHLLVTGGEPLPSHLRGEHLQAALIDALAALISALAARATVAVLLEDWHWADAASRSTLDRLSEIVTGQRVLLVVTTRPERFDVTGRASETRIDLEPLDFAASSAIMRAVLGVTHIPEAFAHQVFERANGNPFFIEQICCAIVEQGAVDSGGEPRIKASATGLALPETVKAVIRTRLDALEPGAREVLRVAAVIGREFQHAVLAEVLDPAIDVTAAISRLQAAGLIQQAAVRPDLTYRFQHVLVHEVTYEGLLAFQRKSLHGLIGSAIESRQSDRPDDAAALAQHFECAGEWPRAIRYGRRAAERASALSQFSDALTMLDRVLAWLERLPDDEARRDLKADLLLQYERECETLGLRGRQRDVIEELIGHLAPEGRSARLAEAYLRRGDLLTLLKRYDAADLSLTNALRISRECGDAVLERNVLRSVGLLRWHEGRFDEALALAESALAIDRERGDDPAVAGDLANLGSILKSMGDYPGARRRLEEAVAMPALARDPKRSTYALHKLANVHCAMGDLESALGCLRHADEINRTHLLPIQRSFHLTSIAHIQLQQGDIPSSLRTYEQAVSLSRRARHAEGLANSLRPLGELLFVLGRDQEALPVLQESAVLFAQLEDLASEAEMWSRAATILERNGRHGEAIETWTRTRVLCERLGDRRGQLDACEGIARGIRRHDPSPGAGIPALEAARDLALALGDGRRELALCNTLGILEWQRARFADARRHYERALRLVGEHGNDAQAAVILNSLGVTLTRLNRTAEARKTLEQGLARSRTTGDRMLQAQAAAALGHLARTVGDLSGALAYFEQSLELRRDLHDLGGEGWMLRRIAETLADLGEHDAATRAAAAASRIANETGDAELAAACGKAVVSH